MMKDLEYSSNILIATIDPQISNVLGVLLNNLNYKIELTNSGSGAFTELKNCNFDLMLLDAILPDMNVIQILNYVKKASPSTIVMVMVADALAGKAPEYFKNGAYDCLKKPIESDELFKRIGNALDQRKIEKEIEDINNRMNVTEKRNQYLVQNSDDIIYTLDYDGNFTSVSNALQQKLGYDNNYLLRKHFSTIIYPEDVEKARYVFNERRTAVRDSRQTRIRLRKNNNPNDLSHRFITVEVNAKGVYDKITDKKDKLFLGTYGIARDITDFIKSEEILKLQKTYFKELFNNSPDAIAVLDLNNRILNANKSFEKLFKYSQKELKNGSIYDLILPESQIHEKELFNDSRYIEKESFRKCRDGSVVDVIIHSYPIEYNNKKIGSYHIYRNIADLKQYEGELLDHLSKVRQSLGSISNAMVSTIEVRDPYTVGHQQRVSNLARAIACEMGLSKDEIDAIRLAGTMHDLGKVNIPAEILSKPGHLSDIEKELIKMHPVIAYEILQRIEFPWSIAEMVYQHHERLDGSGYPLGLKGNKILMGGKILAVADVVESIASHRPYRPALGVQRALDEILEKKNIHFDPKVVDACIRLFSEKNFSFESDIPEENNHYIYSMPAGLAS